MKSEKKMFIAFWLNFSFAMLECVFGFLFRSSAVLADAVHDIGDALAIGLSAYLEKISKRKGDKKYSLGYKRFSLLGAILTASILIIGSFLIFLENIPKLLAPEEVNYRGMLVLALVAIVVNLIASRLVHHGHSHNEAILSLHFLEDILGWLAVILVSAILHFTDWYFLDPLLSLCIASFILSKSLPAFWQNMKIFLEHVPDDVDLPAFEEDILALDNIHAIAQLNVWTTDGLEKFAMLHVCPKEMEHIQTSKEDLRRLAKTHGITHLTIEFDQSIQEHESHQANL